MDNFTEDEVLGVTPIVQPNFRPSPNSTGGLNKITDRLND